MVFVVVGVRFLIAVLVLLAVAVPAQAEIGLDHVASDDVALLANVRTTGPAWAGSVHGDRLLISGPSQLNVFDVSEPQAPVLLGTAPLGSAGEGDGIAGNGRWAAVAEDECLDPGVRRSCLAVFDITAAPRRIASVEVRVVTTACVLDCRYVWATGENAIIDMADPAAPKPVGTFLDPVDARIQGACFASREMRPGVVMVSCDPAFAMSTLPEHGGSETKPVIIGQADTEDFRSTSTMGGVPHSARWPQARDRFMMTTTETPFSGVCGGESLGAFVVWDARPVLGGGRGFKFLNEWRPTNGTYVDGRSPYNAVGCSPHFFSEHPAFRDGGLAAVAALENGVRFLQVTAEGRIEERGYFLGAGGTAAVPVWHPDGRTLYVADYARGLDVLAYNGDTYVPVAPPAAPAPAGPAPPPVSSGPQRFRLLGVIRHERGRATIAVETPGPGKLTATPKARGVRMRTLVAEVRQAGLATLTVVASGRARKVLRRRGRLSVDVRIRWRPRSGAARSARQRVVLRAR